MRIIGFSGARSIPAGVRRQIMHTLHSLDADEYVTGAAVGIDAYVGSNLTRLYPTARHRVIIPANHSQIDPWWTTCTLPPGFEIEFMPERSSYRNRNQRIVERATELRAYPSHAERDPRSRRSGTWQTVRLARAAGLTVEVVILDQFEAS